MENGLQRPAGDDLAPLHAKASFEFVIDAPLSQAAPLFGPLGERAWAGTDWNPQFLHPIPARDVEGAVFTLSREAETSVWVNTKFDLARGRMHYVVFAPNEVVTTVNVALTPDDQRTHASVTYTRTALDPRANDHVSALARDDAGKAPEWHAAIAACLEAQRDA